MRYVFDDYILDTQRYELSHRGDPIKLRPKVFEVLHYLIRHRERVVSKDELLAHLWPHQFIADGSLNACLMAVRKAVGDSGQGQRLIQRSMDVGIALWQPWRSKNINRRAEQPGQQNPPFKALRWR